MARRLNRWELLFTAAPLRVSVRLNPSLDLHNLLNASPILGVNTRYGPSWLTPTQILPDRLFKFRGAGQLLTFRFIL